jgi:hypothetical protein
MARVNTQAYTNQWLGGSNGLKNPLQLDGQEPGEIIPSHDGPITLSAGSREESHRIPVQPGCCLTKHHLESRTAQCYGGDLPGFIPLDLASQTFYQSPNGKPEYRLIDPW